MTGAVHERGLPCFRRRLVLLRMQLYSLLCLALTIRNVRGFALVFPWSHKRGSSRQDATASGFPQAVSFPRSHTHSSGFRQLYAIPSSANETLAMVVDQPQPLDPFVDQNATIAPLTKDLTTEEPTDSLSSNQHLKMQETDFSAKKWIQDTLFLGIELNNEILAIVTIYFVEGALGLARLAQSYLLKDELQLGPAELSALTGLFVLPWTIKPLYGFLSDGFPLFGYRRKSYLILAGIIGGISYGVLSYGSFWEGLPPSASVTGTVAALMVSSACIAFSDVVADGIVVTRTRDSNDPKIAGGLQSLCWGAASIGGLLSAYFSGSLLEVMPARSIFGITAVLPFLVALISFGVDEPRLVDGAHTKIGETEAEVAEMGLLDGVKSQVSLLLEAFQQPFIWKPALFLFLWQSTPTADGAFFFFLTNDLHLGPEFLGRVRLITAGAGLVGVWLYNQYFKSYKIKDILFWSTILSFPLGMLPVLLITHVNRDLGIPDTALIYGDDVALAALGQISFLPTLVLAARLCPKGIEAVLFATLMSIFNGAGTVGTEIGAVMTKWAGITDTNFDNLAWLTVICNLSSLWPLVLIGWLDGIGEVSEKEIEKADENNVDRSISS